MLRFLFVQRRVPNLSATSIHLNPTTMYNEGIMGLTEKKNFILYVETFSNPVFWRVNYLPTHFAALHSPHIVAFISHFIFVACAVNSKYFAYFSEFTIGFFIRLVPRTNSYLFCLRLFLSQIDKQRKSMVARTFHLLNCCERLLTTQDKSRVTSTHLPYFLQQSDNKTSQQQFYIKN